MYLDVSSTASLPQFLEELATRIARSTQTRLEATQRLLGKFFRSLRPRVFADYQGRIGVELGIAEIPPPEELSEVLNLPEKLAQKHGHRLVVAFDEFQEIAAFDGGWLERAMRAEFQHHKAVSYVFAGSQVHLLRTIFEDKTRSFWKFARGMSLGPIVTEAFRPFLVGRFTSSGREASPEAVEWLLQQTRGLPYQTQQLAHELWFALEEETESATDRALQAVLDHEAANFETLWAGLRSASQRRLLEGIAQRGRFDYSEEFVREFRLKTQSHVQKAAQALEQKGIIQEGQFVDPFFEEWIRRR